MQLPSDEPPREARYWQQCLIKSDLVLEPPPYDPELVDEPTKAELDKKHPQRFRKPIFLRNHVSLLWPKARHSATSGAEKRATVVLTKALQDNKDLRRKEALNICRQHVPELSERGFRLRVWPQARKAAGLEANAPPGRKAKQK
jgi:hypothetical protein